MAHKDRRGVAGRSSGRNPDTLGAGGALASTPTNLARILVGRGVSIEWEQQKALKCAWAAWLTGQSWDAFITVTFREPRFSHHALSTLNGLKKKIDYVEKTAGGFLATEEHLSRALHVHGVIRWADGDFYLEKRELRFSLFRALLKAYGRSSVEEPRGQLHVSSYVSKYVVKYLGEYVVW